MDLLQAESSRPVTEAAVGSGARSPRDLWRLSRQVVAGRFDLFFFPAVYSYFPLLSRVPCIGRFSSGNHSFAQPVASAIPLTIN